jgi:tetratricopeptide (TPR) repeat protein
LADLLADRDASDELVGYHLEQAYRYGSELRPLDRRLRRLGADAGERLGAAGINAWKRLDSPAVVNLLTRACAVLPERDSFRLQLLCHLGPALQTAGALGSAEEVLEGAVKTAEAAGDKPREARARLELAALRLDSDPEGRARELIELSEEAIPLFDALGDDQALGRAWRFLADVHGAMHCQYAKGVGAAEHAITYYERSGWPTSTSFGDLAAFLFYGPAPVPDAIDRCRALLARTRPGGEAAVLTFLGGLEGMGAHFDDARRLIAKARRLYEDLGQSGVAETNCGGVAARVEILAGDEAAAEEILRTTCANLERMGNRGYLATRAAEFADVLWSRGYEEEASLWVSRAIASGASDDIPTQIAWRCVRAKLYARRNEPEAEQLVREAIQLSDATDALNQQARARLDLGLVLGIAGRAAEASAAVEAAIELFDRKGNTAASARARALLSEFTPSAS